MVRKGYPAQRDLVQKYENLKRNIGLPYSFDSINLNRDKMGQTITPNTHRYYTHRGWYFNYSDPFINPDSLTGDEKTEESFWQRRKGILLITVNKSLFSKPSILQIIPVVDNFVNHYDHPDNEQCDAFCCFIYNVHILGDHRAGDTRDKLTMIEPLARLNDNYGIIIDLQSCLKKLITEHGESYRAMMNELDIIKEKANNNLPLMEQDDNSDAVKTNQALASEVLDTLAKYMPTLLIKETFFNQSSLMRKRID